MNSSPLQVFGEEISLPLFPLVVAGKSWSMTKPGAVWPRSWVLIVGIILGSWFGIPLKLILR